MFIKIIKRRPVVITLFFDEVIIHSRTNYLSIKTVGVPLRKLNDISTWSLKPVIISTIVFHYLSNNIIFYNFRETGSIHEPTYHGY